MIHWPTPLATHSLSFLLFSSSKSSDSPLRPQEGSRKLLKGQVHNSKAPLTSFANSQPLQASSLQFSLAPFFSFLLGPVHTPTFPDTHIMASSGKHNMAQDSVLHKALGREVGLLCSRPSVSGSFQSSQFFKDRTDGHQFTEEE